MPDQRSEFQKLLWEKIGPPLYYCEDCLRGVKVTTREGQEPTVTRPCGEACGHRIIAPRTAVCVGKGGASVGTRAKIGWNQIKAAVTGRNA
jgi:hypothetical protein